MPNYYENGKQVSIHPPNSDYLFTAGDIGQEPVFYIRKDGTTPFGGEFGYSFSCLTDTPKDLECKNNSVLGVVDNKVGYITEPKFTNLSVEKDVIIDGDLLVKGGLQINGLFTTKYNLQAKALKITDKIEASSIITLNVKSENIVTKKLEILNGTFVDLGGNSITCENLNVVNIKQPTKNYGTFENPVMISKADTNCFLIKDYRSVIIATFPSNNHIVEFDVDTEFLLEDKFITVDVMDLYGDASIVQMNKCIKILDPKKFKVVLNLACHTGNSIIKILVKCD